MSGESNLSVSSVSCQMFFTLALMLNSLPASGYSPRSCPNRSVIVMAQREHAEAIKSRFLVLSSLPFSIQIEPQGVGVARLTISYHRARPQDQFAEPLSMELGQRVFDILKDDFTKLGIKSIRADYEVSQNC